MCLPGTVEAVREQQPQLSRRTVLAGGGAAALAALLPGEALAHKRGAAAQRRGKVVDLTHTFTAGFPVYTGSAPTRRTLATSFRTASTSRSGPSTSTPARTWTRRGTSRPAAA